MITDDSEPIGSVDAVCFDLDDTLCVYRRSGPELLSVSFETAGVEPFFTYAEYELRYEEHLEGAASASEIRERCFADLATEEGYDPDLGREIAATYAAERDHRNVDPLPGAIDVLDTLTDYPLALVTNSPPKTQRPKIDALGIGDRFDTIVYAGYDTPAKPDPEPFHVALSDLGCRPERAVHVGNSLTSDVAGAAAAGLASVWLPDDRTHRPEDVRPDRRIDSLPALLDVLQ